MPRPTEHIKLSQVQSDFVFDERTYTAFVGGVGSGKTYAGAIKVLAQHSNAGHGMVVGPTVENLRDTTWETCLRAPGLWQPWLTDGSINKTEKTVRLATGSKVLFKSADKPDRLRGPNLSWVWIDEAAQIEHEAWQILIGRLREGGSFGSIFVTTTPRGKNWVYQEFVEEAGDDTGLHRCSTADNPFLEDEVYDTLSDRFAGDYAEQELEGRFVEFGAGLIKREWWQRYRRDELPPKSEWQRVVQSWDTAHKSGEENDYSCGQTWIQTEDAYYMWHKCFHERANYPSLRKAVKDYYRTAKKDLQRVDHVYIEDKASGQSLVQELKLNTRLPIKAVGVDRDKIARANAVTGLIESGSVFIPENAPWSYDFLAETAQFPEAEHDDQVDAMTQALNSMQSPTYSWAVA